MSFATLAAPAASRLFLQFAAALEQGDTATRVETPAYSASKELPIGEVIGDWIGGDHGQDVLAHLLRGHAEALRSTDTSTQLHAMSVSAALSRIHADIHGEAAALNDADADDEFQSDYADAMRLRDKDAACMAAVGSA